MIVELGPPEPRESLRSWLLPLGLATLVVVALALATPPQARVEPFVAPAVPRPAVLAARPPAPPELTLPADLAQRTGRSRGLCAGAGGVTGMPTGAVLATQEAWLQFRLTDGRDVCLSRLPPGDSYIVPASARDMTVRGTRGRASSTATAASLTWTESGLVYQLSSRALTVDELVQLANALVPD